MANLMKKFDEVDVLLIDDIQFLADKDKTQEVFHNLFNDFHMKKKAGNYLLRSPSKRASPYRTKTQKQIRTGVGR